MQGLMLFSKIINRPLYLLTFVLVTLGCQRDPGTSQAAVLIDKSWTVNGVARARILQEAIEISKLDFDSLGTAKATYFLGFHYQTRKDYHKADSLFRLSSMLSERINDLETQISSLNNLGQVLTFTRNLQEAELYLDQALVLSENQGFASLRGFVNFSRGILFDKSSQIQKSIDEFKLALASFRIFENYDSKIRTLNYLGIQHAQLGLFELSSDYYLQMASEALKHADSSRYISSLYQSGINLIENGDYRQAIRQSQKALLLVKNSKDQAKHARVLNNMGNAYSGLYKQEKYSGYLDSALFYIKASLQIKTEIGDVTGRAYSLYYWAQLISDVDPGLAKKYLLEAFSIWEKNKNWARLSEVSLELARNFSASPSLSLKYLKLSDSLSFGNKNIRHKIAILDLRAQLDERGGNFKRQVRSLLEKDSLQRELNLFEKQKSIAATSVRLRNVELKNENFLLQQETEYQKDLSESRQKVIIVLVLAFFAMATFLLIIRQQKKSLSRLNLRLKAVRDTILHSQANSINLVSSLLRWQQRASNKELEKKVLSEVNSQIVALGGLTRLLYEKQLDQESGREYVNLRSYLSEIIDETILSVKSSYFEKDIVIADVQLNSKKSLPLALIVNELILNFLKHAVPRGANFLFIHAEVENELINLSYKDNGPGLSSQQADDRQGFGTQMMESLVSDIQGEINRFFDNGLTVKIKVPI